MCVGAGLCMFIRWVYPLDDHSINPLEALPQPLYIRWKPQPLYSRCVQLLYRGWVYPLRPTPINPLEASPQPLYIRWTITA